MNSDEARQASCEHAPMIRTEILQRATRFAVAEALQGTDNVGLELGVASGTFSAHMVRTGKFSLFFGVDAYCDHHDVNEYKYALRSIGFDNNYRLLRMKFDEAIGLFDDGYFDFIYIDGYAHSGEDGGRTLLDWFPKLKAGGVFAGDDYHNDWPLTKWAVNHLASQLDVTVMVTSVRLDETYGRHPSWFFRKEHRHSTVALCASPLLEQWGRRERERVKFHAAG